MFLHKFPMLKPAPGLDAISFAEKAKDKKAAVNIHSIGFQLLGINASSGSICHVVNLRAFADECKCITLGWKGLGPCGQRPLAKAILGWVYICKDLLSKH